MLCPRLESIVLREASYSTGKADRIWNNLYFTMHYFRRDAFDKILETAYLYRNVFFAIVLTVEMVFVPLSWFQYFDFSVAVFNALHCKVSWNLWMIKSLMYGKSQFKMRLSLKDNHFLKFSKCILAEKCYCNWQSLAYVVRWACCFTRCINHLYYFWTPFSTRS